MDFIFYLLGFLALVGLLLAVYFYFRDQVWSTIYLIVITVLIVIGSIVLIIVNKDTIVVKNTNEIKNGNAKDLASLIKTPVVEN